MSDEEEELNNISDEEQVEPDLGEEPDEEELVEELVEEPGDEDEVVLEEEQGIPDIEDLVEEDVDDLSIQSDEEKENTNEKVNVVFSSDDEDGSLSDVDEGIDDFDVRIDDEYKMKYISMVHPEEVNDSFLEMNALANVKRGENMKIEDNLHTTYPILSKYEKTRVLGIRISQLNEGARPLTSVANQIIDNHIIAEKELQEKVLPFIIMRPLPNGKKEYWRLEDLEVIER
jgi:DNA-directed RNA polymerase subunit K/omega